MSLLSDLFGRKDKPKSAPAPAPRPDFSNVRSGSSSTPVSRPAEPVVTPAAAARTVVVAPGDSLSKIAKREYGDAAKWKQIYDANRDVVKDPDLIYPGQKLRIP